MILDKIRKQLLKTSGSTKFENLLHKITVKSLHIFYKCFHCRHCKTHPDSAIKKKSIRQHHRLNHSNIFSWCDSSYHRAWLTWTHLVKQNTHNKVSYYEINWGLCSQRAAHLKTIIIFSWGIWEACCDQSSTCVPCMGDYDKVRTTIQTITESEQTEKTNWIVWRAFSCGNVSIRSQTGSTCCSWRHQIIHLEAVETHRFSKTFGWN